MKASYDPETDIVTCQMSEKRIDHAEEQGPLIIHFDSRNHPVLLEIQGGSRFLGELTRLALFSRKRRSNVVEI